jgi:hypothetical protein
VVTNGGATYDRDRSTESEAPDACKIMSYPSSIYVCLDALQEPGVPNFRDDQSTPLGPDRVENASPTRYHRNLKAIAGMELSYRSLVCIDRSDSTTNGHSFGMPK